MRPKETNGLLWRPTAHRGAVKQGSAASMLEPTALLSSRALQLVWRVRHYTNENMVAPAKPLWFLSQVISLERDQVLRIA